MKQIISSLVVMVAIVLSTAGFAVAAKPDHAGGSKGGGGGGNSPTERIKAVCVDPGHGGSDPGTSTIGGSVSEAQLNLDVAQELRAVLVGQHGYEVEAVWLTREDDVTKSNNDRYTYCNATNASVLVSIHHNGSTDTTVDYPMALYQQRNSVALAETVGQAVADEFAADYNPAGASLRIAKFPSGVLIKSDMPSMMSEGYFMTSESRSNQLNTGYNSMVSREAQALAAGIESYYAR